MDVGFVGLGAMGQGMAQSLLKAGHRLTVWNRTRSRAEALQRDGAKLAGTPADAARTGIVFTMLADDPALEAVCAGPDGILKGLPTGGLHISCSTVSPDGLDRWTKNHATVGQALLAAPVFGRPDAAFAAKLFVVASGPAAAVEKARPLLEAVGQRVFVVGEEPSKALFVKLAGNFLLTGVIEALAESSAVMRKAGIEPEKFLEVMTGSLFTAPVYQTYGKLLLEGRFKPGFALPLGAKDNRLWLQAAERCSVPLPMASLIRDRMLAALARGYAEQDWSAFGRIALEEAGLTSDG
ncbi:MAG: NAD(P)-dependent oxidoreductase [Myxococcales bacterium]